MSSLPNLIQNLLSELRSEVVTLQVSDPRDSTAIASAVRHFGGRCVSYPGHVTMASRDDPSGNDADSTSEPSPAAVEGASSETATAALRQWTRLWVHGSGRDRREVASQMFLRLGQEHTPYYVGFLERVREYFQSNEHDRHSITRMHPSITPDIALRLCGSLPHVTADVKPPLGVDTGSPSSVQSTPETVMTSSPIPAAASESDEQPLPPLPYPQLRKPSKRYRNGEDPFSANEESLALASARENYNGTASAPPREREADIGVPHADNNHSTKKKAKAAKQDGVPYEYCYEKDFSRIETRARTFTVNGAVQVVFLKGAIPDKLRRTAANCLRPAAVESTARKLTNGGRAPHSGIVGYYDYLTTPHEEKCRLTAFSRDNASALEGSRELISCLDGLYQKHAPVNHRLQDQAIPNEVRLFETVFSTVTVNAKFRTALHTDSGDFKPGLGVLTVLEGKYQGLFLGIPTLDVAIDVRPGDVVLFNTDLLHGNTESRTGDDWSRMSLVAYLRTNLFSPKCLSTYHTRQEASAAVHRALAANESHVNLNHGVSPVPLMLPVRSIQTIQKHQLDAVRFVHRRLLHNSGALLCLDMGMGKTLVVLSLCHALLQEDDKRRILVLVPVAVLSHWEKEYQKWALKGTVMFPFTVVHKSGGENEALQRWSWRAGVLVMNYERFQKLRQRSSIFETMLKTLYCCVLDEGHRVKNSRTIAAQSVYSVVTPRRVVLSGTPLQNDLKELYVLLRWVDPTAVPPEDVFQEDFQRPLDKGLATNATLVDQKRALHSLYLLQSRILNPIWIRMADTGLPSRVDNVVLLTARGQQAEFMPHITMTRVQDVQDGDKLAAHPILLLKTATNLLFVGNKWKRYVEETLKSAEQAVANSGGHDSQEKCYRYGSVPKLIDDSSKLYFVHTLVRHAVANGEKTLVFCSYSGVMDMIEMSLLQWGIPVLRIDGSNSTTSRVTRQHQFTSCSVREAPILLLSIRALGVGVEFTCASRVVLFEPTYNPTIEHQAIARAHRFGQPRLVHVYRLLFDLPTDARVFELQAGKHALSRCVMHDACDVSSVRGIGNINEDALAADPVLVEVREHIKGLLPYSDCFDDVEAHLPVEELEAVNAEYALKLNERIKRAADVSS
eukprot:PhM_4_TR2172/c0_g1_i1/m.54063